MKVASALATLLSIVAAALLVVPGCDASKKDEASAKKEKSKKKADDEGEDEDDGEGKKKKKKKKGSEAGSDKPTATATQAATTTAAAPDAPPSATGNAPPPVAVTNPSLQTYPDLPNKIADSCTTARVIMATAPNSVGPDYPWTWSRQAMLANQQFKVVEGNPSAPGEVTFELHLASDKFQNAWVLVGKCHDGGTCNKLAAMYKAIVKGSVSQPVCGTLPMDLSPATFKKPVLRELGRSQNTLPDSSDVVGQCARLQACSVAMDPPAKAGKEEIGVECQKTPTKFKTSCATRYPCAEVMKCLEGN